jgi:RNA polymerase sigma-70 factor (ECF subfamily)
MQVGGKGDTIDGVAPAHHHNGLPGTAATQEVDGPALVRAAGAGDADAMDALLEHAQDAAYRFGVGVCGGPDDAEDVAQEALLKTYQHADRIREPGAFRSWLYRTVRNACLMHRRVHAGEPRHLLSLEGTGPAGSAPESDVTDPGKGPEDLAINSRLREHLRQAFAALPPSYREVVFLRDVKGLSTREAANSLGTSEDNVKTRLRRARQMLRERLEHP